ncbi:MAG: CRISPR-associated protein Cas4 [Limnochordia bacterium]|jgi:CRISPR-associated exonuclease Cas4|nr:CRISPR-associated protein Cas4 [Limnochordia bacterium]MDD4518719.1 CRISPR-associated protein Cas4 [Limnochordia bacterium]
MLYSEDPRIGGTVVWYYMICPRQVWFITRGIEPNQDDDLLLMGRIIDQTTYRRDKHSVVFGDNRFDIVRQQDGALVIAEVKKSSKSIEAARLQLAHYLYELENEGFNAKGLLQFPTERRTEEVILDERLRNQLEEAYYQIQIISKATSPPVLEKRGYCKSCAYVQWCWS